MRGQSVEQKYDDEEIKGVEGPSKKARAHSVPAIGVGLWGAACEFSHLPFLQQGAEKVTEEESVKLVPPNGVGRNS